MRWEQTEFLLKGFYLGLLVLVAMQDPSWLEAGQVALCAVAGLVVCLGIAAWQKLREGYRVRGRLSGFILFLLLENPVLVYTGLLLGLTVGAYSILRHDEEAVGALFPVAGGMILGQVFWYLRHVRDRKLRLWLGLGLAAALVGGAILLLQLQPTLLSAAKRDMVGYLLLLGIPGFYLLTFAGMVEESEIEMAAICAALGTGLWILGEKISPNFNTVSLVLPIALYFLYTRRILPGLRVFKHVLRGLSYAKVGRYRPALVSLGRALELDPDNALARETLWRVHQDMDYNQLVNDPETLAVVNFELCLERVAWLLLQDKPKPEQVEEAHRLLDLVSGQRPAMQPRCNYWRAVACTHQGRLDEAVSALETVLAEPIQDTPQRRSILLQSWQLALFLHPELKRRVGGPMLAKPGRRMEAIASAERQLALKSDDAVAWDLKRFLYSDLTESEYIGAAGPDQAAKDFDHDYVHQLGLALVDDKERWQRACEYLRLAARGLPAKAPVLFIQIGRAHEKAGDVNGLWNYYDRAMQAGRSVGPAALAADDRHALFAAVKQLGDHAITQDDVDRGLDCFKFYSQYERAGLETYRTLAQLFEQRKDVWMALHCTEHGLTYDSSDRDLLQRKDRYYYSITPDEVRVRRESIAKWFDPGYCKQKARWVLEKTQGDLELLDWAAHLVELAQAFEPSSLSARVLRARVQRLRGEIDNAVTTLEDIRAHKPEKFANTEEEDGWYLAHRLLGELYVDDRPDQAILCLQEFRNSPKSGANTMFNLGRAYENVGDRGRAQRCYEQVLAFEGNPLVYEAQEALDRLRSKHTVDDPQA
jgi:tetratricopeptide (TPR) repeat protein